MVTTLTSRCGHNTYQSQRSQHLPVAMVTVLTSRNGHTLASRNGHNTYQSQWSKYLAVAMVTTFTSRCGHTTYQLQLSKHLS